MQSRELLPAQGRGSLARRCLCCITILPTLLLASGSNLGAGAPGGRARMLERLLADRFTAGRLAASSGWRRCVVVDSLTLVPRSRCDADVGPRAYAALTGAARHARQSVREDAPAVAVQRAALLELRLLRDSPVDLDAAVVLQERAQRMEAADPSALSDLAVMYMELGERDQQLLPMLQALDAVERALARDSTLLPALFNRALVLERLYLVGSARRAWERYRHLEQEPGWKAEADEHLRRLEQWPEPVSWQEMLTFPPAAIDNLTRTMIAERVNRSPGVAREFSFEALGEWGRSVLRGDQARAARLLGLVRAIGDAAQTGHADLSIARAVAAIDTSAPDSRRVRGLACAHVRFAEGFNQFFTAYYEGASATLGVAEQSLRSRGSPAAGWATFYRAAAEMNRGHFAAADRLYRNATTGATDEEPALTGKAIWARGVNQVRQGNYERAIAFYRDAVPYIVRAREPENLGAIQYLVSEALLLAGQTVPARAEEYQGLRQLSRFRRSGFLNNHLTIVTLDAREAGLEYAALAVMNEVIEIAGSVGRPDVVAWAFQARAREHAALGQAAAARGDLEEALRWGSQITAGAGRDRIFADVMLVRGQMLREADPAGALDSLAAVVRTYRRIAIGMNLPAGLFEASRAAEAAGRSATARRFLEEAIREIEAQQASYHALELRATRAETVEHVFDAMIRLELDAGRPAAALEYLERSRMAAWARDTRPGSPHGADRRLLHDRIRARIPADMLFLDYALLSDRLVVWTASRAGWRHHTIWIGRDSVAALVDRFEREASDVDIGPGATRARLFELLIRPAAGELRRARRLVVVPDRELFRLPFSALWDGETRTYVVERFQVGTLPNAGFFLSAARAGRAEPGPRSSALVVGNPAVDRRLAATLPSLPSAAREADEVARLYPASQVLRGADAWPGAVLERLPGVSVFHFAGHAVFNSAQPELSYLALAAGDGGGILQARQIGRMRLSNLQVVVLSACSTLNPRPSRAGGNAGLAYSFLRAEAPATLSTLWDVGDNPTSDVLVEFHRRLVSGVAAPEALRQAQVALLHGPRRELHAPKAWAAFVYTGP